MSHPILATVCHPLLTLGLLALCPIELMGCKLTEYEYTSDTFCGPITVDEAGDECHPGPPECGCAEPDKVCAYSRAEGRFMCLPSAGNPAGSICQASGDCRKGLGCAGQVCRSYCQNVTDCQAPASAECIPIVADGEEVGARVCINGCDPVSPALPVDPDHMSPCSQGQTCLPVDEQHTGCLTLDRSEIEGALCGGIDQCAAGTLCDSSGHCSRFCWIGGSPCVQGSCRPVTVESVPFLALGALPLGVCRP